MSPSYPIVFYISGHGFGHTSRTIEAIRTLVERRPDVRILVRTAAPRRLFEAVLRDRYEFFDVQCDAGMVQLDSLNLDAVESIRRAKAFEAQLEARAAEESAFLLGRGARLVVGDIPPLAFVAAHRAGLPSIAIGNFTWDWIYEGYPEESPFDLAESIRRNYQLATMALRLPASGGFAGLEAITRDIPFIARRSTRDPRDIRRSLALPDDRPLVLMSFGAYGIDGLNVDAVAGLRDYAIVTTSQPAGGLHYVSEQRLDAGGFEYVDLIRAADVVVTKPGYGIFTDAVANDAALLYTSRGRFVEYEVLVGAMPRYLRSQFIDPQNLLSGNWRPFLDRLLASPPPPDIPDLSGAQAVVEMIEKLLTAF
jgi:UDP:flavonoid glycosyltransferase YjiC (YdhE family)